MTELRIKVKNGKEKLQVRCPKCHSWVDINHKQAEGKTTVSCLVCEEVFMVDPEHEIELDINA